MSKHPCCGMSCDVEVFWMSRCRFGCCGVVLAVVVSFWLLWCWVCGCGTGLVVVVSFWLL